MCGEAACGARTAGSVAVMWERFAFARDTARRPSAALLALGAALGLGVAGRVAVHAGAHLPRGGDELAALGRAAVALGGPWLAVAWAVGAVVGRPVRAALTGGADLALGTFAWYAASAVAGGPAEDYARVAPAWAAVALAAGAVFGLAGAAFARGGPAMRTAALALVSGTLAGEALLLFSEWTGRASRAALAGGARGRRGGARAGRAADGAARRARARRASSRSGSRGPRTRCATRCGWRAGAGSDLAPALGGGRASLRGWPAHPKTSTSRARSSRSSARRGRSIRASRSATSTCAPPTSTASATSTSTCSASTSSPRRATCPAGARPATSCSSPPAAITTTSASTRGSRPAAPPQPDGVAGLHHVAIRYPTRAGLADAVRRLQAVDWPLRQVTDHGTHEAVYISDPDGNDLELCWDRPFDSGRATRRARRTWPARSTPSWIWRIC